MFRPQGVPEFAENLDVMTCIEAERRPSIYAPPLQAVVTKLKCPSCCEIQPDPGQHQVAFCKCGVFICVDGSRAWIWRDRGVASAAGASR